MCYIVGLWYDHKSWIIDPGVNDWSKWKQKSLFQTHLLEWCILSHCKWANTHLRWATFLSIALWKNIAKISPKPLPEIMPRVRRKSATCGGFWDIFAIVSISNQTTRMLRLATDFGETHHARLGFVYNTIGQDTSFQGITMQCMCVNAHSIQFDNIPTLPML